MKGLGAITGVFIGVILIFLALWYFGFIDSTGLHLPKVIISK